MQIQRQRCAQVVPWCTQETYAAAESLMRTGAGASLTYYSVRITPVHLCILYVFEQIKQLQNLKKCRRTKDTKRNKNTKISTDNPGGSEH